MVVGNKREGMRGGREKGGEEEVSVSGRAPLAFSKCDVLIRNGLSCQIQLSFLFSS